MDIRDNLKAVIHDKNYVQAAIARKSNLSPAKLSQILSKERRLEANELYDICETIGLTPMELKDYKPRLPDSKGR